MYSIVQYHTQQASLSVPIQRLSKLMSPSLDLGMSGSDLDSSFWLAADCIDPVEAKALRGSCLQIAYRHRLGHGHVDGDEKDKCLGPQ